MCCHSVGEKGKQLAFENFHLLFIKISWIRTQEIFTFLRSFNFTHCLIIKMSFHSLKCFLSVTKMCHFLVFDEISKKRLFGAIL